jgi:hypothetical protein
MHIQGTSQSPKNKGRHITRQKRAETDLAGSSTVEPLNFLETEVHRHPLFHLILTPMASTEITLART